MLRDLQVGFRLPIIRQGIPTVIIPRQSCLIQINPATENMKRRRDVHSLISERGRERERERERERDGQTDRQRERESARERGME